MSVPFLNPTSHNNFAVPTVSSNIKKRKFEASKKQVTFAKKVAKELKGGRLVDYYKLIPRDKSKDQKQQYATFDDLKVTLPFQWVISGGTGAGKTNLLINLIDAIGEFKYIYLFAKLLDEPLYEYLIKKYEKRGEKAGEQRIFYSNDIKDLPDIDEIRKTVGDNKALLIVDDMVNESSTSLKAVCDSYGIGRKINLSCIFLTQQFYKTPKFVRDNSPVVSIGRLNSVNDLHRISKELSLEHTPEELAEIHENIQRESPRNFLTIDLTKSKPEDKHYKYRKNLAPIDTQKLLE